MRVSRTIGTEVAQLTENRCKIRQRTRVETALASIARHPAQVGRRAGPINGRRDSIGPTVRGDLSDESRSRERSAIRPRGPGYRAAAALRAVDRPAWRPEHEPRPGTRASPPAAERWAGPGWRVREGDFARLPRTGPPPPGPVPRTLPVVGPGHCLAQRHGRFPGTGFRRSRPC